MEKIRVPVEVRGVLPSAPVAGEATCGTSAAPFGLSFPPLTASATETAVLDFPLPALDSLRLISPSNGGIAGRQYNKPTSRRADEPTSRRADEPTSRRADEPTSRRADEPTSRRADEPTSRRADEPTSRRADEPTSRRADEPTSRRADEPTSRRADEPTSRRADEPTSRRADEPTSRRADEPTSRRADEPTSRRADEPNVMHAPEASGGVDASSRPGDGAGVCDGWRDVVGCGRFRRARGVCRRSAACAQEGRARRPAVPR